MNTSDKPTAKRRATGTRFPIKHRIPALGLPAAFADNTIRKRSIVILLHETDLTTRPVRADDVEGLVQLIRRNFDEVIAKYHSAAAIAKFSGNASREKIAAWMEAKEIYVVEANGEVVAIGALACFPVADGERHYISQFFVRADLHRQGIGSTLLSQLIQVARRRGIRQLHVPNSRNAISFYHTCWVLEESKRGRVAGRDHLDDDGDIRQCRAVRPTG